MQRFAFVIHPLSVEDFTRKFGFTRRLPARWVEGAFRLVPPFVVSHITGVRSVTGTEAEGWFVGLPLTPRTLFASDLRFVYRRLLQCAELSERLGAGVMGLGAFTAIVGDAGVTVAAGAKIAVTTGNSYTAATGVEGALLAAQRVGIAVEEACAVVVGATGSIGAVCSRMLARKVPRLTLVARNPQRLARLRDVIRSESGAEVAVSTDVRGAVADGDVVLTVSSATDVLIEPEDLKPGSVVCDVARPRNVSRAVHERRDDVLVIDGSVIRPPGDVDFGFDFGLPPGLCDACMAETMILALEGRYASFTLGRDLTLEQVEEIAALGRRHGFHLAGFRRFERAIPDEEVERIRRRAGRGPGPTPEAARSSGAPMPGL
ncbi:MAG: shikimate dehydrogenase [Armatimonadota bacterium]|nr:shikimate dehydrogenase [Armatimonadota bacterium]MDR5697327.1 shikimate dehydrogenase [Armatimonadota bacterium]